MTPPERLLGPVRAALETAPDGDLGVAVSGGGDSVALLLLARASAEAGARRVLAVTVDHGLRAESAGEAAEVAALCARIGVRHDILRWRGWDGRGNLQDRARRARRALISKWARGAGLGAVALGHTLDDQAETFVMHLARGSGVDGLAAMASASRAEGVLWLRPMLGLRRDELRGWLGAEGIGWAEDPGNEDAAYARVRVREALMVLSGLGVDAERLAGTAARMGRARSALEAATEDLARTCATEGVAGDIVIAPAALAAAPVEIRLRLLAAALMRVSGAAYRPRLAQLERLMSAVETGRIGHGATLHGCVLRRSDEAVAIRREPRAMAGPVPATGRWDGRWEVDGPVEAETEIGGLGASGLAGVPDWRACGLARETLLATPALWRDGRLIDAPFARGVGAGRFRRVSAGDGPWSGRLSR